MILWPNHKLDP